MFERLFNGAQYLAAYKAGLQKTPLPSMQPKLRILPKLYRSSYRYNMDDLMFAYYEGFYNRPRPKEKVWK
jgi:hypothetical protein